MQELIKKETLNYSLGSEDTCHAVDFKAGAKFILQNPKAFNLYIEAEVQELVEAVENIKDNLEQTGLSLEGRDLRICIDNQIQNLQIIINKFEKGKNEKT